jgi:hypothetical protein
MVKARSPNIGFQSQKHRPGRSGKSGVRKGVGGERRASDHDEISHNPGDDGHDRARLKGMTHEIVLPDGLKLVNDKKIIHGGDEAANPRRR